MGRLWQPADDVTVTAAIQPIAQFPAAVAAYGQ
jgi:hypothetical protein